MRARRHAGTRADRRRQTLADRVVIRRDTFGVPHILAETEAAAGFGFGYAQAEDHAAEMGARFLAARGDAARHLGTAALDADLAARRMDNIGEARRALAHAQSHLPRRARRLRRRATACTCAQPRALPPWVPEITAAEALAQTRAGAATAAASPAIVRALQRKYPEAAAAPSLGGARGQSDRSRCGRDEGLRDGDGSNAFALSGRKTRAARPSCSPTLTSGGGSCTGRRT